MEGPGGVGPGDGGAVLRGQPAAAGRAGPRLSMEKPVRAAGGERDAALGAAPQSPAAALGAAPQCLELPLCALCPAVAVLAPGAAEDPSPAPCPGLCGEAGGAGGPVLQGSCTAECSGHAG